MVRKNFLKHSLSQSDFEKCLDGSGLALWHWDVVRDVVTLSKSAQKILGKVTKGRNVITSIELGNIIHPDDREDVLNAIKGHFRGLGSFETEFRVYKQDGSQLYLRMVGDSIRKPDGRVTYCSGYIQDITADLEKQNHDHFNMHILDDLLKYAPVAAAVLDKDLCYISWSEKWLTQFKINNKNIKGQSHLWLCPEIERYNKRMLNIYNMVMDGKSSYRSDRDFFYQDKNTIQWITLDIHPWYNKLGDIAGIIIYQDIINDGFIYNNLDQAV